MLSSALPGGEPKYKIGDTAIMTQILERWNSMNEAERAAATEDKLKEMVIDREMKETSQKATPLALLTDIRRTLAVIEKEVCLSMDHQERRTHLIQPFT